MPNKIQKTLLPNGMYVVTEEVPGSFSASVGVWLDTGSRDERHTNNGIAHLYEHMVFKGTPKRTGLDIVQQLEAKGGQLNAFTTKEQTCFYAKVVEEEVGLALDVLLDMAIYPLLDKEELIKEKEVVIEELKGCDDNPDERVYDLFGKALFGDQGVGLPIGGTVSSVEKLERSHLTRHLSKIQKKVPLCISVVGKAKHKDVLRAVQSIVGLSTRRKNSIVEIQNRKTQGRRRVRNKATHLCEYMDVQQATVTVGTTTFSSEDSRCFTASILNCVLGDGMSSRLFQKLREECGYVYHINSFHETMVGKGTFGVSFSTEPKYLQKATEAVVEELLTLKEQGISKEELRFAKNNVKGNFLLDMESTQSRMGFLARMALGENSVKNNTGYLRAVEKVTQKEVNTLIQDLLKQPWASACILPKGQKFAMGKKLVF
jgi:predicted Zn-dependent peptidase